MSSESLLLLLLGGQAAGVRDRGVCAGADVTARSAIVCCACRRRRQQSDLDSVIVNNRLTPARLRPRASRRAVFIGPLARSASIWHRRVTRLLTYLVSGRARATPSTSDQFLARTRWRARTRRFLYIPSDVRKDDSYTGRGSVAA